MKKYELTDDTIEYDGRVLYRIRALKDFGNVEKGDLGGFVESEENLSHEGNCWIYDNAKVFGNAKVYENARIYHNALVFGNAEVYEFARICGDAVVCGNAKVYGTAFIQYGSLEKDIKEDLVQYIATSLNVYPNPQTNTYILYKKVKKIDDGVYCSIYDENFIYRDNEVIEVKNYDSSFLTSCAPGLHVSTPFYWDDGDTIIAVEVHLNDIITCMSGKIRCKRLKVLGEVKHSAEK